MLSSADRRDFNITDFYHVVANSRPVSNQDTSIVVVDIALTNRYDVTNVLELLADFEPKAVGLDVTFNDPKPDDERLLEVLDRLPNLVMAVGVSPAPGSNNDEFLPDDYSYFYNQACSTHSHGVVNLPTKFDGGTIRQFRPSYPMSKSDTIPSLALALARIADPSAAARAESRGNDLETIDFPSRDFDIVRWFDLPECYDKIHNKIVLVGAIGELGDTHITPIDSKMAGVAIHAYALSTLLRGNFYTVAPRWVTVMISFALCFLLCLLNVIMRQNKARALVMRIIQLFGVYFIAILGYTLFIDRHIIIDFSYTLLMLLFGFFAVDIWFGTCYLVDKYIIERMNSRKKNT